MQIEKRYTKAEILTLYANQINLGHGAYGVEAASRMYFDKSAKDLTLEEAATIAAIIQTPARLSPFVNPDRTLARRNNYVLPRMAEEGFITREQAAEAAQPSAGAAGTADARPLDRAVFRRRHPQDARAEVRRRRAVSDRAARADDARRRPAGSGKRRHRPRPARRRQAAQRLPAGPRATSWPRAARSRRSRSERWSQPILAGDIVPALVHVRARRQRAAARASGSASTRSSSRRRRSHGPDAHRPRSLFKVGDVIEVNVRTARRARGPTNCCSSSRRRSRAPGRDRQPDRPDPRDGRRLQLRAAASSIARRRPVVRSGSLFKPFVYTAAIDRGFTPISTFIDEPVSYEAGPNQPPYRAAQLRPQVRRPRHAAARARAVAQHSRP